MAVLANEIGKRDAFALPEQEAMLNIVRTAAMLEAPFEQLFRRHGISKALYNILRIVRGLTAEGTQNAGGKSINHRAGVPLGEIGPLMICPAPDVSRLVDRLESLGLAERRRSDTDRRVVLVKLLPKGRGLLKKLDPRLEELHRQSMAHLTRAELRDINRLMIRARSGPDPVRDA